MIDLQLLSSLLWQPFVIRHFGNDAGNPRSKQASKFGAGCLGIFDRIVEQVPPNSMKGQFPTVD